MESNSVKETKFQAGNWNNSDSNDSNVAFSLLATSIYCVVNGIASVEDSTTDVSLQIFKKYTSSMDIHSFK